MNYVQATEYIAGLEKFGSVLGLENMTALLKQLDNPEKQLKIIHIAGTNGKGSVGAFVGEMLKAAGYKVGRYVSPTVFCYEERFQINGENISNDNLAKYTGIVKNATENIPQPTVFEVETAISLCYFRQELCDYVLLEVGLGGRLDATNAVEDTLLSVITSISLDHTAILGDTIGKIAFEKAGIIKKNGRVITTTQQQEAFNVLKEVADKMEASISIAEQPVIHSDGSFDYKKFKNLKIKMQGNYQYQNACLAIEVFNTISDNEQALKKGLENASWQGRFQVIDGDPTFIFDGAHNPQGVTALTDSLKNYRNIVYICGIFADKSYEQMIKIAAPLCNKVFTVTPPSPRGLDAQKLAQEFLKYKKDVVATTIDNALEQAFEMRGCTVVVFGSLSFLGDAINYIKEKLNGQR